MDQKLEPAIKPFHGQVNARDVYDIERFDDAATRGVVVTAEDNAKYYSHFDHTMSHQWQEEVLSALFLSCAREDAKLIAKQRKTRAKRETRESPEQRLHENE